MKIFLCLKEKPSAVSDQLSEMSFQLSTMSNPPSTLKLWQLIKRRALDKVRPLRFLQLILVFVSCSAALAQEFDVHVTPAAQAVSETNTLSTEQPEITALKIGDKIPDELWEMYFPVVSADSEQVQYLSLGDFKDKLIILDFWATWCAPCIPTLNTLNDLQNIFEENLLVVPVTSQPKNRIKDFIDLKNWGLSSVFSDESLRVYFPHLSLPYQVWIYDGKVNTIPEASTVTRQNIQNVIDGKENNMIIKFEMNDFDKSLPLFNIKDNIKSTVLMNRGLTAYIPGLNSSITKPNSHSLSTFNIPAIELYKTAFAHDLKYHERFNRVIIELDDSIKHRIMPIEMDFTGEHEMDQKVLNWRSNNLYCYSAVFPKGTPQEVMSKLFKADINAYFSHHLGIKGEIEKRTKKCLVITNTKSSKVFKAKHNASDRERMPFESFLKQFLFVNLNIELPIIDETTDTTGKTIYKPSNFKNIDEIKQYLQAEGMDLIEADREIDLLVISLNN